MKLFGNKRNSSRTAKRGHRLSGVQRGLILLLCSLLVLGGTIFAVYKDFVKPVDVNKPGDVTVSGQEEEIFVPPTFVQMETQIENGKEVQVEVEVPASHKEGFYNILIVGTDAEGSRTDTIMIGRIDVKNHTLALMSIPRDTLIDVSYAVPKINGVYAKSGMGEAGIEALKTQLARLLGFEVDGYALVNLQAFVELVDLVGGVDFYVPQDMDYDDPTQDLHIHLKEGQQLLDGQRALEMVRFRGYAAADIQRTKVQQDFMRALADKYMSMSTLLKLDEIAEIFLDNVTTDMTVGNLIYFGQELLECDYQNMFTYTLEGEGVMVKGGDYYALYRNKTLQVINEYFNPYDRDLTEDHVKIRTPEEVRAEQEAEAEQPGDSTDGQPSDEQPSGNEGSGNEGSGNEGSGNEGSGNEGSGNEGSGNEGSGNEGSGNEGSGNEGGGNEGGDDDDDDDDGPPVYVPGPNETPMG